MLLVSNSFMKCTALRRVKKADQHSTDGNCCPVELIVFAVAEPRRAAGRVGVDYLPEDECRSRFAHQSTHEHHVLVAHRRRRR